MDMLIDYLEEEQSLALCSYFELEDLQEKKHNDSLLAELHSLMTMAALLLLLTSEQNGWLESPLLADSVEPAHTASLNVLGD